MEGLPSIPRGGLSVKSSYVGKNQIESLWVKISDQGNKGNFMVGVHYRLLDQGEPVDETFLLQLWEALVLLGDLNCPDVCRG